MRSLAGRSFRFLSYAEPGATNTSAVERRTLTLPAPVTASQLRLVVQAANTEWGNVALNELTVA